MIFDVILNTAPSGPPQSFHISVVNCSAIRAEWDLPSYDNRNGIVRGYKLIILYPNGSEIVISCTDNITQYIIGGLEASMRYVVSVLAYTVGDGPRSIHLTATTNPQNMCKHIVRQFRIYLIKMNVLFKNPVKKNGNGMVPLQTTPVR